MKIGSRAAVLVILASLLWACSPPPLVPATPTPVLPTALLASPTSTEVPTATPEPGKVWLVAPAGSDAQAITDLLTGLSEPAGLLLVVQPELQPLSLGPDARLVVFLSAPPNLAELLDSAPQAQFVVLSNSDLPPAQNLSAIRLRPENRAFLAGFISVLLTPDWRSAGLLPADGPLGAGLQEAYINGGRYFCGVCAPGWPLGMYYPQAAQLPSESDGTAWQTAAAGLFDDQKVEAFYMSAEAASPQLYAYLRGRDQFGRTVLLVGDQAPPDELRGQWAATVSFDVLAPLRQMWPNLLAGRGGVVMDAPLALSHISPAAMGEGRLRLVEQLIDEIAAGRVYPFTLPQE
jgi:hypothetical protein